LSDDRDPQYTVLPYLAGITSRVQLGSLVTAVSYGIPAYC